MDLLDRINNCKVILKDLESNCSLTYTTESFKDIDSQCEYLDLLLEALTLQTSCLQQDVDGLGR